jgi:hypothetical protein
MANHHFQVTLRSVLHLTAVAAVLCVIGPPTSAEEIADLWTKQAQRRAAQAREAKRAAKSATARRNAAKLAKKRQDSAAQTKKDEISEIGIERHSGGFFTGSDYTFIVNDDLTFRYEGRNDVERIGKFTGNVPRESFDRLAQLIKDSDFMGLEDQYQATATDVGTVYSTVVMNGKRYVVMNGDISDCPKKLSEIEKRIDLLLEQAEWDETEEEE